VEVSRTAETIMDMAEMLIQTRGYNSFSYKDISEAIGIRNASIHHHFPSKTDLGVAVVKRYTLRFGQELHRLASDDSLPTMTVFERYLDPYRMLSDSQQRVCLCGSLAGEFLALPEEMRDQVNAFFAEHQSWLKAIFERALQTGEFDLPETPAKTAKLVLAALQGALLIQRSMGDIEEFDDVVASVKAMLTRNGSA